MVRWGKLSLSVEVGAIAPTPNGSESSELRFRTQRLNFAECAGALSLPPGNGAPGGPPAQVSARAGRAQATRLVRAT